MTRRQGTRPPDRPHPNLSATAPRETIPHHRGVAGRPSQPGRSPAVHRAGEAGCGAVTRCRFRCRGWGTCGMPSRIACDDLGFDRAPGRLRCSGQLALARIIEPVSKLDSLRVLEIGVSAPSHRTVLRRLPVYARASWRRQLAVILTGYQLAGSQCPTLADH
jgi:hypothetical protein